MKLYKIMFAFSMISGTLIAISASSWLGMWIGLEINLLSIIPLLISQKNILSNEATIKYFVTQAMASSIVLFAILTAMAQTSINSTTLSSIPELMMNSALLTKMGAAPFHFWFPEVMEGLQWTDCFIMLTWQKIAPMVLLMYNLNNVHMITIFIVISMIVSGIMGFNQTSMRKILTYSSINHIAWMLAALMMNEKIWMMYFLVYTLISLNLVVIMHEYNCYNTKQMFSAMNSNTLIKILFIMNFFSLGGLPPFLGFMPKWMTIQLLIENNLIITSLIMVMMTLVTLYFYMRLSFSSILISSNENNWNVMNYKTPNKNWVMTLNFISISGLILCTLLCNSL